MVNKITKLIKKLNEASKLYYNSGDTIMSDKEWDEMFDELKNLEEQTGIIMSNSPTQKVGYETISKLKKVKHTIPMLSLDKTKDINDLISFSGNHDTLISLKMDGMSIRLTYDNGELIKAETRGNGETGEDITHNAKMFDNIPLKISNKNFFEIDGEAIISYENFEKINSTLPDDKKFKNPRNLVSGTILSFDSSITKNRHVKFVAWKIPKGFKYYDEALNYAKSLGFEVVSYFDLKSGSTYETYETYINGLKNNAKIKSYPIDGMVLTLNDMEYGESLGMTSKFPRHSLAFKFYDEVSETHLRDIEYTMGKTGILTPVAIFDPVEIEGTTVNKASLHNLNTLESILQVPYKGQRIGVCKRNMIIPYVEWGEKKDVEELDFDEVINIPSKCPYCGEYTVVKRNKKTGAKVLFCTNDNCSGNVVGKLSNAASKEALNIDGLSEATIETFHELGILNSIKDLYHMKPHYSTLINLDGFGRKSIDNLFTSIEKSRNTTFRRFLYALHIPLIGVKQSKLIEEHIYSLLKENENVVEFFVDLAIDKPMYYWSKLEDFGDKKSESIKNYVMENFQMILDLSKEFTFTPPEKKTKELVGKTFVITGSLNVFKNRKELENVIVSKGGKVTGSVTANTSYLINNDVESTSSKNKKAKELNIPIITEEDFLKL